MRLLESSPGTSAERLKPLVRAAIQNGNLHLVSEYLNNGGSVNARDQRGRTPLMLAAAKGHAEVCRLLLDFGADLSDRDDDGRTALEIANDIGEHAIVTILALHAHPAEIGDPDPTAATEAPGFGAFQDWQPEASTDAPVEDPFVRSQVLNSQAHLRSPPHQNVGADWNESQLDLPEIDSLTIQRELRQEPIPDLLSALIGEAKRSGMYRESLVSAIVAEIDGNEQTLMNLSQMLGDMGFIPEGDEETWFRGFPIEEDWDRDHATEECIQYLHDLRSELNDPDFHLRKDVRRSVLLDRDGETRIGRLLAVTIRDACEAIANDARVTEALEALATRLEEEPQLAGRLGRLDDTHDLTSSEDTGEDDAFEIPNQSSSHLSSRLRSRLSDIIEISRDSSTDRKREVAGALEQLGPTTLTFRILQCAFAESGTRNQRLASAIDRAEKFHNEMFMANVRLAISVARKYAWSSIPSMDLIQEAFLGLLRAIERFDYNRGTKFSTYATWWIRQSVTRAISDKERLIRVPVHMMDKVRKLASATRSSGHDTPHEIPIHDLMSITDLSRTEIEKTLSVVDDASSWEESPEDLISAMTLADDHGSPFGISERLEMKRIVLECVESLPTRQAEVIKLRFGLADSDEMTLEEIGKVFHLTRERIRQIESKALAKLRNKSHRIAALCHYTPGSQ